MRIYFPRREVTRLGVDFSLLGRFLTALILLLSCGISAGEWQASEGKATIQADSSSGAFTVKILPEHKGELLLRPAPALPLPTTTLRMLAELSPGSGETLNVVFLVIGDDGKEREFPSRQIRGRVWSTAVSDYLGGERKQLESLRPDLAHPRGEALPVGLSGIRIKGAKPGELIIKAIAASEIEYLKHRRWELVPELPEAWTEPAGPNKYDVPMSKGMHPFGPEQPEIRLDWLLPAQAGHYQVQWSVADRYQGRAINSGEWQGDWNPAERNSVFNQRLVIPLSGAGTYWITFKIRDRAGTLLNRFCFPAGVVRDTPYAPPPTVTDKQMPTPSKGALLAVDCEQADYIFPDAKSAKLTIAYYGNESKGLNLRIVVKDATLMKRLVLPQEMIIPLQLDQNRQQIIPLNLAEQGAAYHVCVDVLAENRLLDRELLKVGVREEIHQTALKITQPVLADVFGPGKVVVTNGENINWYAGRNGPTTLAFPEYYQQGIDSWKKYGASLSRVDFTPEEVQPLPGFFDLRSLVVRVNMLNKSGLPYMFSFGAPGFHYSPDWLPFQQQEDLCGLPYVGLDNWANAYFMSPAAQGAYLQPVLKAIYERFKNDANFLGWVFWTDILFAEHGERRTDFSPMMQDGFVSWLKDVAGITTLADLNARYGTALTAWEQVGIPLPPPEKVNGYSGSPDRFSPQSWRDYWAYRMWIIKHLHNDQLARYCRQLGDTRPIGFYSYSFSQDEEDYLEDLISLGCFTTLGTEGSPSYNFIRNKTLMPYYAGHSYLAEYQAFLPGFKEMLERDCDRILATVMLSGGNNLNIAMFLHGPAGQIRSGHNRWREAIKGLERQTAWLPALKDYATSDIIPWQMGVFSAGESAGGGLSQYLWPANPHHLLKVFMSDAAFGMQKMVWIPATSGATNDPDFTPRMREKALRYVMNGGKLVLISPDSARFTRDNRAEQFALLTELGWRDRAALLSNKKGPQEARPTKEGLFHKTQTLQLEGSVPDRVLLPVGATVEAQFINGQPAVVRWQVGKGEVLLFVRELIPSRQKERVFVDDLMAWADIKVPVTIAPSCFYAYTSKHNSRFLMLYREQKVAGDDSVLVRISDLPEGIYATNEMGPDKYEPITCSSEQWRKGVNIRVPMGMRLLKITLPPLLPAN